MRYRAKIFFRAAHVVYIISLVSPSRHDLTYCQMARGFVFSSPVSCEDQGLMRFYSGWRYKQAKRALA